jgi:hypothetical protein
MLEETAKYIGLGYLLVLALFGYTALLEVIKKTFVSKLLVYLITLIHFILGICGVMFFPAYFLYADTSQFKETGLILFSIIVLSGVIILLYVAKYLNNKLQWK